MKKSSKCPENSLREIGFRYKYYDRSSKVPLLEVNDGNALVLLKLSKPASSRIDFGASFLK